MRIATTIVLFGSACTAVEGVRDVEGTEKFRGDASGTVAWTGPEGLNVRDQPSTTGTRVGWLPEGAKVTIVCQTTGDTVQGNDLHSIFDALAP